MAIGTARREIVTPVATVPHDIEQPQRPSAIGRFCTAALAALAAGWACLFIVGMSLERLGLLDLDWTAVGLRAGEPWRQIINSWLGPQFLLLNGLLGMGYLAILAALKVLAARLTRRLLGRGLLVHLRWLIDCGLYPASLAGLYAATQLDVRLLRVTLDYSGESVILTAPTLVSALLFSSALVVQHRQLDGSSSWGWRASNALLMTAWSVGMVLYIDRAAGNQLPDALEGIRGSLIACALSGWVVGYLLIMARAGRGHVMDVSEYLGGRRGIAAGLAIVRMTVHLAIMLAPVVMGVWLVWFAQLPAASTVVDRHGRVLQYRYPAGQFRLPISAQEMPHALCLAADAVEDAGICTQPATHLPVSPQAIGRNLTALTAQTAGAGGVFTGGSGLAAQVCKNVFGRPPVEWTARVVRGAPLAAVTGAYKMLVEFPCAWVYERAALLAPADRSPVAMWLNLVPFGRGSYGVEAASLSYFDKPASELSPAEAVFIVSRAQAPYTYDPAVDAGAAMRRTAVALELMARRGYLAADVAAARDVSASVLPGSPYFPFRADSAFIEYAIAQLADVGFTGLSRSGLVIRTSLDADLQAGAEAIARRGLLNLEGRNATAAALIALDPATGAILAMVGGTDGPGGLNLAVTPRQPGSAIKPLVYLTAFEAGWTPATVVWDLPREYPGQDGSYRPVNYDGVFHGPVQVRYALANSYNVPAVAALEFVGIPVFLDRARRLGLTTLTAPANYGPALALGGAEVTLLDLTAAYAVLANQGLRVPPTAILEVQDAYGRILYRVEPRATRVARAEDAYLLTDILADDAARAAAFGAGGPLRLDRPAAAKTGTTNDYRDSWTIGYTADLVAGVWVGNPDNRPMAEVAGALGAAPIWHTFMEVALQDKPAAEFAAPRGVVTATVCADSGARPAACPSRRTELFAEDRLPPGPEEDWWQTCPDLGGQATLRPDQLPDTAARDWLVAWEASGGVPVGCPD